MARKPDSDTELIYSTEHGRMCPACSQPLGKCTCNLKKQVVKIGGGNVRVGLETKGRNGKGVTTISGISVDSDELKSLAKKLKQKCGCGGTVKDGVIEIQGDHRDMLMAELNGMGFRAKKSGG